ncbi:MAG TPA: DUF3267 domain-containing protein [Anaerolineales bacterium]|nr:DUF3267 domain-containing protein [Anaerolineales bacterium]
MSQKHNRLQVKFKPSNRLPAGFRLNGSFSLTPANFKMLIGLNVLGAVLFFLFGWLFLEFTLRQRPEVADAFVLLAYQSSTVLLIGNLLGMAVMLVLHELVHGFFFWFYTRARPHFGLRLFYAFAAAPDWYLPRNQYFVVALAPLALLTLGGLGFLLVVPPTLGPALLFGLTMNAAGSIGDIAVVIWLLRKRGHMLVNDLGDSVNAYTL